MKKYLIFSIGMLFFNFMAYSQKDYLGILIDDYWLNNYYTSFQITKGQYDEHNKIYPNSKFEGYTNNGQKLHVVIETNNKGKVNTITYDFKNVASEDDILSIANNMLTQNKAAITKKDISETRLFIEGKLSSNDYSYKMMYINADWGYNGFGQFFFYGLTIRFIMT